MYLLPMAYAAPIPWPALSAASCPGRDARAALSTRLSTRSLSRHPADDACAVTADAASGFSDCLDGWAADQAEDRPKQQSASTQPHDCSSVHAGLANIHRVRTERHSTGMRLALLRRRRP